MNQAKLVPFLLSIPLVATARKETHEHYVFNVMEVRAVTCFNTWNLLLKDSNPYKLFRSRDKVDRWCLERVCEGRDSYEHDYFA